MATQRVLLWSKLVLMKVVQLLRFIDRVNESVATGVLATTAAVSPLVYDVGVLWTLDLLLCALANVTFAMKHWENILRYSPISLPLGAVLATVLVVSTRSHLNELTAWVPFGVGFYLLVTAVSLPFLLPDLRTRRVPILPRWQAESPQVHYRYMNSDTAWIQLGENLSLPGGHHAPEDIQGTQSIQGSEHSAGPHGFEFPEENNLRHSRELEVSGMVRSPSRVSEDPSNTSSEIDLEAVQATVVVLQRLLSTRRTGFALTSFSEGSSETDVYTLGVTIAPVEGNGRQRTCSPSTSSSSSMKVCTSSGPSADTRELLRL